MVSPICRREDGVGNLANWYTAKWIKVEHGSLTELADIGEVNMGDDLLSMSELDMGISQGMSMAGIQSR